MTRLDRHILSVRNRLTLSIFCSAWAWAALGLGLFVWAIIVGERVMDRSLGHWSAILWGGLGVATLGAFIFTMFRRPTAEVTAVAIDEKLGLKEKFSTALYARHVDDPMARAAVLDAEQTAGNVSVYKRFPLKFPSQILTAGMIFFLAFLTAQFMQPMHLFAKAPPPPSAMLPKPMTVAQQTIAKAELPKIEEGAQLAKDNPDLKKAADELADALKTKEGDDATARRRELEALQDYKKAMSQELEKNKEFQTAMDEKNQFSQMPNAKDDSTPLGKAQNELRSGNIEGAMKDINQAVSNFDKMTDAQKQKTVDAAKQLAQDLAKAGDQQKMQEKLQQQMQQMGASQQQAQQMSQLMQQAAQGNQQAQQQLQQMAQQMQQQMNNGQGPTKQQQQQIQSMMAKAQSMANSQAQAQAMSNAAQQLAQAMAQTQAASQQGGSPGQSQSGQAGQQGGASQSMAQAQQNLQQQMAAADAIAKDAEAMQAAQSAAGSGAEAAAGGNGSGDGGGEMGEIGDGNNEPPDHADQDNPQGGQGAGGGGGGKHGSGGRMGVSYAPGQTKQVIDPSADNANGKFLASRYVKAPNDAGVSTAQRQYSGASADKDSTDDVDDDHVSREAQDAVKQYFNTMQNVDK